MDPEKVFFLCATGLGIVIATCLTIVELAGGSRELELSKVAAQAGLVQISVKYSGYAPKTIWVKPGTKPSEASDCEK